MGLYLFENIESGEYREVYFKMTDKKDYCGENGNEIGIWERRFTVPQAAIDSRIDCWDSKAFVEKTGKIKGGTVGELWTMSKEASDKRAEGNGFDPVKQATQKAKNDEINKNRAENKRRAKEFSEKNKK